MLKSFLDFFRGKDPTLASAIRSQVDDGGKDHPSSGWSASTSHPHDYDPAQIQENYNDALTAWRKNPIAYRTIGIITDYVVGDQLQISSPNRSLNKFISEFWHHPKNHIDLRLEEMSDELSRAGDLFVALFRNDQDGMSYLRFVTKDQIVKIETAPNDWETELVYYQQPADGSQPVAWFSMSNPEAINQPAVMLHYSVNKVMGALLGEGDLSSITPWLQRYSRMLEDRVRLHWALRSFLWFVTVPTSRVAEKKEQYRNPPESGSIVVKDESEKWEAVNPQIHGQDAAQDMKSVRGMIDAGSGLPPHWRGDASYSNLATAKAMQAPTERHLLRRQQYFTFMLEDILYSAYQRAFQLGMVRKLPGGDYSKLFTVNVPDISREDNESLSKSAQNIANGLNQIAGQLGGKSTTFNRLLLKTFFKFAGDPQPDEILDEILSQVNNV